MSSQIIPKEAHYSSSERDVEVERKHQDSFKIYIHTLAQHSAFGPGTYGMHALKSMTGTTSFEELPESQTKRCVHITGSSVRLTSSLIK